MFGSQKTGTASTTTAPTVEKISADNTCVLAAGTIIEGNLSTLENIRLDGKVKGDVTCGKRLVMGEDAKVEGNVVAQQATIKGYIQGNVTVRETLELMSSAKVKGIITASQLTVEQGGKYEGECRIGAQN